MDFAIVTEQISREYSGQPVVDRVSLRVPEGSIYGLLGPSSAGKTTVVRMLLGLLEPTSGFATVLGYDTRTCCGEIRALTGALLETPGLYDRLTAEENLDIYARILHLPETERVVRNRLLLEHFGLWQRRAEPVEHWNLAQQRKLAVARLLINRPKLVLFDEPTVGLEPMAAAELRGELASIALREGITVLIATDDLAEVDQICQRTGVLHEGKLLFEGAPSAIREQANAVRLEIVGRYFDQASLELIARRREVCRVEPDGDRVWIDLRDNAHSAPIVNLLVDSGVDIEEVRRHEPALEVAYQLLIEANHDRHYYA